MQDGTDGTIIILDWRARDATRRKRARAHTCRGRRRISRDSQTVRIGGQIIIRSHNRACPFLLLAFSHSPPSPLFFFQWHHENFHLAPLIYRNLNLSLSLYVCVNVSTGLPRGPVVLRLLLVSRTLAFLSSRSSPPIIRDSSVVVRA